MLADSNLVQLIKKIAREAVRASKPCDYCVGAVASVNPLKVKVSNNIILDDDFFYVTESVKKETLKKGDKLLMFRKQGGNEYMITDRVVR